MQIMGFSYICRLRGTVNLTAIYNNDSMITCMVNQTQVINYNVKGKNLL